MNDLDIDLDPRLLVLPVEGYYLGRQTRYPVNGVLILSTIGLHFYGQQFDAYRKTFFDIPPEHIPLFDVQTSQDGVWATVYRPLGKIRRMYNPGYTKAIGTGRIGPIIAGIGNMSKHAFTNESRTSFISSVKQVKKE